MITKKVQDWGWRLKRLKIKTSDFADRIGVSHPHFSSVINGNANTSVGLFEKVEKELATLEAETGIVHDG